MSTKVDVVIIHVERNKKWVLRKEIRDLLSLEIASAELIEFLRHVHERMAD